MVMPLGKARDSTRSSAVSGPVSGNSRVPWPTTTGTMSRFISSTRSFSSSHRVRAPLPCTCSSPAGLAFSSPMAAARVTGEDGRVRPARFGERVRCDVLGLCVQGTYDGVLQIFPHAPVAGEELVGPPAEQERVGALVELVDERHGLAVEQRPGPSAALESAAACCWIQPAVSLQHSIDGDLHVGRQFHGFVLSLVLVFLI